VDTTDPTRSVLVAGATGLVGQQIVKRLLKERGSETVHALVRRLPDEAASAQPRLTHHIVDFRALPALPPAHECYIALGTTIKDAGSLAAFRSVDRDAVVAVAQAAKAAGVRRLALVSALGASAHSSVAYNRVKGEAEDALIALGFARLVVARPSLLRGDRAALGQRARPLERMALMATAPFNAWLPSTWRPIEASTLAHALVRSLRTDGPTLHVLESSALHALGR
jgi:uncharacterized protein YbjT (DUF2867 family)